MNTLRIRKGDTVKIIAGADKGKVGKIERVDARNQKVYVEGIGTKKRNVKPSQLNPRGGTKDIHVGIPAGKVALVVDEKQQKTSRVGYKLSAKGNKTRVAKALNNKEIT